MESLPQTILFILTLVCGLSCGLLILGILALYLLGRLNIVRDLLGGLRGAVRDDEIVDQAALPGTFGEVGRTRQQSSAAQRVAEARARADREFQSGVSPASPTREIDALPGDEAPPLDRADASYKARYKRRFREENPDLDDEVDSYFDDTEL